MQVIDLSLPINRHMQGIPNRSEYEDNPTRCVVFSCLSENQLEKVRQRGMDVAPDVQISHHMMTRVEIVTHVGTHIDAPCHFIDDTPSIDEIPLADMVKPGRVIPLTHLKPRSAVTADDILATNVPFDSSVIPILHTGWTDRSWGTDEFWGEMIYLHTSAAELMVERGVSAVAMDFFPESPFWLGIDLGVKPGRNHTTLLGNGITIVQMLTNIGAIPPGDFTLAAAPLKLEGVDGSPARVMAIVN
jgi:arylformamidase